MSETIPKRFQERCRDEKRHRWNWLDRCERCGAHKVTGKQRMAAWRERQMPDRVSEFVYV